MISSTPRNLLAWHWRLVTSHVVTRDSSSPPLWMPRLPTEEEVDDKVAWHLRTPGILADCLRLRLFRL